MLSRWAPRRLPTELLRTALAQPRRPDNWDRAIAAARNAGGESFWPTVDAKIGTYFDQHGTR